MPRELYSTVYYILYFGGYILVDICRNTSPIMVSVKPKISLSSNLKLITWKDVIWICFIYRKHVYIKIKNFLNEFTSKWTIIKFSEFFVPDGRNQSVELFSDRNKKPAEYLFPITFSVIKFSVVLNIATLRPDFGC